MKRKLSLLLAILLFCPLVGLSMPVLAAGCPHNNVDRSIIENYEPIIDNNESHELICWMTTLCLDCMEFVSDVELYRQEEPHRFEADGSVFTCVWCEYKTTTAPNVVMPKATATPKATAMPKATATPTTVWLIEDTRSVNASQIILVVGLLAAVFAVIQIIRITRKRRR